jgi:small redox-active disulfide protein 2
MSKKIEVVGAGCPTCKNFYELVKKTASEIDSKLEVEYSTDISKIISLGIMSVPVLLVNDNPVIEGSTSDTDKIKKAIIDEEASSGSSACDCCGGC